MLSSACPDSPTTGATHRLGRTIRGVRLPRTGVRLSRPNQLEMTNSSTRLQTATESHGTNQPLLPSRGWLRLSRLSWWSAGQTSPLLSSRFRISNTRWALWSFSRTSLHQSGIHVRIYRKRLSANFIGYDTVLNAATDASGDVTLNTLDTPDVFFLLAEFRLDETNKGIFYDNGEIIPDYSRRLRDIHGYQTFSLYPMPDKRYLVDLRCLRRPDDLEDDSDTPLVHAEATNVLISRALMYLYESMGNHEVAMICQQRYEQELLTLWKRYGDLRPASTPVLRRLSRARSSRRGGDFYRKWYNSSST